MAVEGLPVHAADLRLPALGPGEEAVVEIPGLATLALADGEAWLTVRFVTAEAAARGPTQATRSRGPSFRCGPRRHGLRRRGLPHS